MVLSLDTTLAIITFSCSVWVILSSAEYIAINSEFNNGGLLDWKIIGVARPVGKKLAALFDALYSFRGYTIFFYLRILLAAIVMLFSTHSAIFLIAFVLLTVSQLFISYRTFFGDDGSDQMSTVILVAITFGLIGSKFSDNAWTIAFAFIAAQLCLSYFASGAAKLCSAAWRNGSAIHSVMNHSAYGNHLVAHFLENRRLLQATMCWSIIIFQVCFPLVFVLPLEFSYGILIAGGLFHLSIAITMGLNLFFPAFLAGYPALFYVLHLVK